MTFAITELIKEQAFHCLIMAGGGVAFMIFYQICSFAGRLAGMGRAARAALEILFWAAAAVMVWQFLYYCAYGSLSIHAIAAFAAGALLWKLCFCGIIAPAHNQEKRIKGLGKKYGKKKKEQSV